ncbi:hypothetical protein Q763_12500 [Flavobacterium beibuense F44-8]|uniref:Uncharacterized protein n=1 Tax=Flavobacterium beibuense F44-8 TaxID=1406840 RepID=A0A0A2LU70_9FLAO|nr:hypothetical protein Q763_12500 [Flavobacterium beibuense F44-8]
MNANKLCFFMIVLIVITIYNCILQLAMTFAKIQKDCIFAPASPTRPAPVESSRAGTQQRYTVVAVRCRSLAIFFFYKSGLPMGDFFVYRGNCFFILSPKQ